MREVWADMRARFRERRFASDARAGSWVRAEAARRELQFLRERWRPFTILLIGAAALISAVSYLAPAGFVRGFAVGSMSVATAAMICVLTIEASGTTMTRMGATAEQWTAAELRPLRRSGWHLINHHTGPREIDHLLIGPAGIVVAETKWSISEWRRDGHDYRLRQALPGDEHRSDGREMA